MSNPIIDVKINYDVSLGSTPFLFLKPLDIRGSKLLSFQFKATGLTGLVKDSAVFLKVSNDGINWFEIFPGTTVGPYFFQWSNLGTAIDWIFIGIVEAVNCPHYVNFSFYVGNLTGGIIENCVYSGEQATP